MSKDGIKHYILFSVSLKSPATAAPTRHPQHWWQWSGDHTSRSKTHLSHPLSPPPREGLQGNSPRAGTRKPALYPGRRQFSSALNDTYFLGETDSSNIVDSSSPSSPNLSLLCFWGKTRQKRKSADLDTEPFKRSFKMSHTSRSVKVYPKFLVLDN